MTMNLTLATLAEVCKSSSQYTNDQTAVTGMVLDTRQVTPGSVFVALKGESVDGHDFLAQARDAGACAALVSELREDSLPQVLVDDVTVAFAQIAQYWRQQVSAQVIAITGSNGKTTVKEMIAAILSQVGKVIATKGNLNNQLGVPLTLARLSEDTDYAVIEMGTNFPGEIAQLVSLVEPDVSVITNIGAAHLAGLGSVEGVAAEKSAIYQGLKKSGTAIINNDMSFASNWQQLFNEHSMVTFGLEHDADFEAHDVELKAQSSHFTVKVNDVQHYVDLPLPGLHNVANAIAAMAAVSALGISISTMIRGLASMVSVPHRLQLRHGVNQSQLIDDSYNANPSSYARALDALAVFKSEHWLVLGDFGELGTDSQKIHYQLGLDAKAKGVARLFTIGEQSHVACHAFGEGAEHFDSIDNVKPILLKSLNKDVTCLIKGSHFMRLDTLADALALMGER
jgi:UDP-N-acetylmuramoyl-tripeptide--D-alanyl-D-alanine ligase